MNSTQLETPQPQELALNPNNPRERELMLVEREFSLVQRKAKALSSADILPTQYHNNIPNCMIAMEMAQRMSAGELEIMQNLHIIQGRPSFSSSYLIGQINTSGVIKGRLRFEMTGTPGCDDHGCRAIGLDKETEEVLEGTLITIEMAKNEGWYGKKGSKWKTMPEQMLQYRAAAFWSRVHAPDVTMGMHTTDEIQDSGEKEVNPVANAKPSVSSVQEMINTKKQKSKPTVIDAEPITDDKPEELKQVQAEKPKLKKKDKKPSFSAAFESLSKGIDIAGTHKDLDSILQLDDWKNLNKGEAQKLQALISEAREHVSEAQEPEQESEPSAVGIFGR